MPVAAPVQKGVSLIVGFGSLLYTGYVPEDGVQWNKDADETLVTDENGAAMTKILMNPRDVYKIPLIIKSTNGDQTPPLKGSTITIINPDGTSTAAYVNSGPVTFSRGYAKLEVELVKEDSMSYS
jgi:hypothetical protein